MLKKHPNRTHDRIVAPAAHATNPKATANPRHRALDADGIACVGEHVNPGDVYINVQARDAGGVYGCTGVWVGCAGGGAG